MTLVFHRVSDDMMLKFGSVTFAEIVETIYENGGRCVTFRELGEYVDPDKAWSYTHPEVPAPSDDSMAPPL
jgi:hypothetical protein